eukprot:gb/GECG01010307.1/.p1 GENE.gb/GECG01010307.1/~~gb/GECG01010307.1/.p1  ORF type:complete len:1523 (+),score=185.46 gb/GECG01010307.1/:1-4569(+)
MAATTTTAPPQFLVKDMVSEANTPKKVSQIRFGMFHGSEMARLAEIPVVSKELYKLPTRKPAKYGVLDPRLGISHKKERCHTCGSNLADCPGHYGVISLELPVFHIGFLRPTIHVLQCICKRCSRVLLAEPERSSLLQKMRSSAVGSLQKTGIQKKVIDSCKKLSKCPHCGAFNGTVKKVNGQTSFRVLHERFKGRGSEDEKGNMLLKFQNTLADNPDLSAQVKKLAETITPLHALELFQNIPDEDLNLIWISSETGRPENMILTKVLVPPVCIRPSVAMDSGAGSNEDDLTVKLQGIIHINNALQTALEKGGKISLVQEEWDLLQVQVAAFLHGELPGMSAAVRPKKPIRGLCQRLKGKQGRFRGNLSGKRVDFSGRTVITPDPNLPIEAVGIPELMARILTYPERVTDSNIDKLRRTVRNGTQYPGANFIKTKSGFTKSLQYGDRDRMADQLRVGDIVERHLVDDDPVLFNRQPSLHKMSIMCHRARVMSSRTLRFNECVCAPYNADFDGDEMNVHVPQTEEARTEAALLMDVRENIMTPRDGEPLVAACQDFITAGYLLTKRDVLLNRDEFCSMVAALSDSTERIDIPDPAILKPVPLWTGKQVISMLLRPGAEGKIRPTFELKGKGHSGTDSEGKEWGPMDPAEGYVVFRNGEHLCGLLDKKCLGGSKVGLIYVLCRDYQARDAASAMLRLTKMCTRWLTNHGFSIGIQDVMPSEELSTKKNAMVESGYQDSESKISQFKRGTLPLQPGCDEEQSLESELNGVLGRVRDEVGQMAVKRLSVDNAPRVMSDSGAKGSTLNICQMIACVGQQAVNGGRIPEGFINRTLPIFYPKAKAPAAKGFVANSFFTGLTATEFFFHTMGGREGLVDTAVKTAETGYMQRRMMKALEDLSLTYDRTVRTASNDIVQFEYGDDGLDPGLMENNETPVDFYRLFGSIKAKASLAKQLANEGHPAEVDGIPAAAIEDDSLSPEQLRKYGQRVLSQDAFRRLLPQGKHFHNELLSFTDELAKKMDEQQKEIEANSRMNKSNSKDRNAVRHTMQQTAHVSSKHLKHVFDSAIQRYNRSKFSPGEAVGAVAAHSCGEPATQMTLKTFHFAGVASMNVTLGVPRIKEIMNASRLISTPIIEATLVSDQSEVAARIAKARIEKTTLGEICSYIREVYEPLAAFLEVKLDLETVAALHMDVNAAHIAKILVSTVKLKLKPSNVIVSSEEILHITPPNAAYKMRVSQASSSAVPTNPEDPGEIEEERSEERERPNFFYGLQFLKSSLPTVTICGIPTVNRAVITKNESGDRYKLLVEGYDLLKVMGTPGIVGTQTKSNHIIEIQETLGIEAARAMIISELNKTYGSYGIGIDPRHMMLLADVMTYRGEVLGITRFGIAKMKDSVLMLASFEKTPDHLFDAAVHSKVDSVVGVSECIIMGVPIPLGTGAVKLLQQQKGLEESEEYNVDMEKPQEHSATSRTRSLGQVLRTAAQASTGDSTTRMVNRTKGKPFYEPPPPLLANYGSRQVGSSRWIQINR